MTVNNYELIRPFVPETFDGDSFLYTEMLDRSRPDGNNKNRLLKTFYHRSQSEFDEQMPLIRQLCELSKVRAYTRLGLRSYKKVAATHLELVTKSYIDGNHQGVKTLYNKALGISRPANKLWIVDCDSEMERISALTEIMDKGVTECVAMIPSKRGIHLIVKPFDMRKWTLPITIQKDNPTNLYIPDDAV